jgi:transglutaminase-like putative cysteine protease
MWITEAPPLCGDCASRTKTVATLQGLPAGPAATASTLREMRRLVREAVRASDQRIRELALQIVGALPERKWLQEIMACHAWVRDRIRYVRDPVGLELVQTPAKTLEYGQGDCDDKCTLLAALLTAIGHPAKFVALGFGGGPFSHVIVETRAGPRWVACETIQPRPTGWSPPDATSRYELKV